RHPEPLVHRVGDGRSQPQAFARGLAFEPLENAAQPRAPGAGTDGQPVGLIIRAGLGAELRPRKTSSGRPWRGRGAWGRARKGGVERTATERRRDAPTLQSPLSHAPRLLTLHAPRSPLPAQPPRPDRKTS